MISAGWAQVFVFENDFQRQVAYEDAASEAEFERDRGVWTRCALSSLTSRRPRRGCWRASTFMHRYYRLVSRRRFERASGTLSRRVRRDFGPFTAWRAGHRRTLGVSVLSARARLSGRRAVVSLHIRSRDRDACTGRAVRQFFRGQWVLAPRRGSLVAVNARMRKTAGRRVRLSKSECPAPKPPPPPPPQRNCDPNYSGCLDPNALDYDCAGGSGDGPKYTGRVEVLGDDHYGLDSDGDGVGCED